MKRGLFALLAAGVAALYTGELRWGLAGFFVGLMLAKKLWPPPKKPRRARPVHEQPSLFSALKESLGIHTPHPLQGAFDGLFEPAKPDAMGTPVPGVACMAFATAGKLAALCGIARRELLTLAQSRALAETAAATGYSLAPDPHFSTVRLPWEHPLCLYPLRRLDTLNEREAARLTGLLRLLYLACAVMGANGKISEEEAAQLDGILAPELLLEPIRQQLLAAQCALTRCPEVAATVLAQLAKAVPPQNREPVFTRLVHLAAADGDICFDEQKMLRRIARLLGLEEGLLPRIVKSDPALAGIRLLAKGTRKPARETAPHEPWRVNGTRSENTPLAPQKFGQNGELLPEEAYAVVPLPAPAFQLDTARIAELQKETHEVIALLAEVMAGPEPESGPPPAAVSAEPGHAAAPEFAPLPEWAAGLEPRCHTAFAELLRCLPAVGDALLPEADFNALAHRSHLLPDALFHALNAWADEALGDFLLERTAGGIRVFRELLP
jgi:uncharacterized tellurite resistance protein B-like protein